MLRLRGAVHMMQNEWEQAAGRFREAIAIKPDDAASHQDLGMCLLQLGESGTAMSEFREAVRYQADLIDARIEIARLLLNDAKWEDAERELQTVLDLSPDNPVARQLLKAATEKTTPADDL
jgi:Flp pilus assembly protein TadD